MSRLKAVTGVTDGNGLYLITTSLRCWLDIDESAARAYATELQIKYDKQSQLVSQFQARLSNKSYVSNAPHKVVAETKQQLAEAELLLANIATEQRRFVHE